MNTVTYFLTCIAEEANELSEAALLALFQEPDPKQHQLHLAAVTSEYSDLKGALKCLTSAGGRLVGLSDYGLIEALMPHWPRPSKETHLQNIALYALDVAKAAHKAQRFGLTDKDPGRGYTNAENLARAFQRTTAWMQSLPTIEPNLPFQWQDIHAPDRIEAKCERIKHWMNHSIRLGTLIPTSTP